MMLEKIRRMGRFGALLAIPLLAAACSDDDDNGNPANPTPPVEPVAQLRVAHLSPDAPAVDVRVNGALALEGAPFMGVTNYLPVPAGSARIQVTPAGATAPIVIDATIPLGEGTFYTVAATGLLSAGDLKPIVLIDSRGVSNGQARVRFVHASPDAPAVDVAVTEGPVLFDDVSFREYADYAEVPGGSYDLEVRVAGTETVALPLPGFPLSAGRNYTVFAIGQASNGSLEALPVIDAP